MKTDFTKLAHVVSFLDTQDGGPDAASAALAEIGVSREDLSRKSLEHDSVIEAAFLQSVCTRLGDPTLGIRAGLAYRQSTTLTAYISHYSKDLRAAIATISRYYEVVDPAYSLTLQVSGNAASYLCDITDPRLAGFHRDRELMVFGALARMRVLTGVMFNPIEARFAHPFPEPAAKVMKITGFPVVFGAEKTELVLTLNSLDLPIPTFDPDLREHLTEYGDRLLQERPQAETPLRAQVESLLVHGAPGRISSADEVADALGMSRRTLTRKLQEAGLSFREIVEDLRFDLAQHYIAEGFNLAEIAFYLGYGTQSAFSSAFKRWSGSSPGEFRAGMTT